MVKGTTRQVIIVKGADTTLFDQAIFLVRDDVLAKGGVSEDALLRQAKQACNQTSSKLPTAMWSAVGAGATGLLWLLTAIL